MPKISQNGLPESTYGNNHSYDRQWNFIEIRQQQDMQQLHLPLIDLDYN